MWIKIRQSLAAPVFEDEDTARVANLLNVISLALLGVAILGTVLVLIQEWALRSCVDGGLAVLLALGVQYLMRHGRVRLASVIQLSVFWLILFLMQLFLP